MTSVTPRSFRGHSLHLSQNFPVTELGLLVERFSLFIQHMVSCSFRIIPAIGLLRAQAVYASHLQISTGQPVSIKTPVNMFHHQSTCTIYVNSTLPCLAVEIWWTKVGYACITNTYHALLNFGLGYRAKPRPYTQR